MTDYLKSDNTRVVKVIPIKRRLTQKQKQVLKDRELKAANKKNQSYIYDADKARYYKNLQSFYNNNAFGYGINGVQTNINYTTPEGQRKIEANYNYSKRNVEDFLGNALGAGASGVYSKLTRGVFHHINKDFLGSLRNYINKPIGSGAEAVVIDNTPTTVGKITTIPVEEMAARSSVPNAAKSTYIGYVKRGDEVLPTYIQNKVQVINDGDFSKWIKSLDKLMNKVGFKKVSDPQVQYRAYTNGKVVIDDISPGNIGKTSGNYIFDRFLPDFFKKPVIIDMGYQTVPEWLQLGYTLKRGGKINVDSIQRS